MPVSNRSSLFSFLYTAQTMAACVLVPAGDRMYTVALSAIGTRKDGLPCICYFRTKEYLYKPG